MTKAERCAEALSRAQNGMSKNDTFVFMYFTGQGLADVRPRENILTYDAWQAKGRQVRKGEHGCKVAVIIETEKEDKATGEKTRHRRPWSTAVFHESQTDAIA